MRVNYIILLLVSCLLLQTSCKKKNYSNAGLVSLTDFGSNPGNLNAFYHEPENATSNNSLLVALHGCTQNALDIAKETGWDELADEHNFYVLYPEQRTINNPTRCFNWFWLDDTKKNQGEVLSIQQMILALIEEKNINPNQVYITGLSAGGAMSMAMISAYPEFFKGAAIMAGLPYKAAVDINLSIDALTGFVQKTPQEWGDLVRIENPAYTGTYPKLAVFHGTNDNVVNYQNGIEIVKQWTDVLNISLQDKRTESISTDIKSISYYNSSNEDKIRLYEIQNLGHAIAIDPGDGATQGGTNGQYTKDKDFYSSYWAAKFMGLIN